MREIKFRAWNKEWGMLLPVDKIFFEDGKPVSISVTIEASDYPHTNEWEDYEIGKDIELMQYTGLKDKNRKEIYEGDVVKIPDDYEEYGFMAGEQREVYYLDGCFRLKPKKENTRDRGHTITDDMDKCEVIGNIYENQELLNPHIT